MSSDGKECAMPPERDYPPGFVAFWDAYACHRRRGKPLALKEWVRLRLEPAFRVVLTTLEAYKRTSQWRDGYMPEPARWLKREPWLDEPTPEPEARADKWEWEK